MIGSGTVLSPRKCGLTVVALLVMGGCGGETSPPEGPMAGLPEPTRRLEVESESRRIWYESVGTINSRTRTTLSARVQGRVIYTGPEAGAVVEEGALLVRIDDRDLEARQETARSELDRSRAEEVRAKAQAARIERLFEGGAATAEQRERAEADRATAIAAVAMASERLREAEISLDYAVVRSPLEGVVIRRLVEKGDMALPGTPLYEIHDPEALRLEARVRESAINNIALGDRVSVYVEAANVNVSGTVAEIEPQANAVSRAFLVKIDLPASEGLFPGMYGKALLPTGEREALFVPRQAVRYVGQLATLLVEQNGRWVRRYVSVGQVDDSRIEILSGLSEGEVAGWNE